MAKAETKDHTTIYELGNRVSRSTVAVIDTVVQRGRYYSAKRTQANVSEYC